LSSTNNKRMFFSSNSLVLIGAFCPDQVRDGCFHTQSYRPS
jgi:hypothetical protein